MVYRPEIDGLRAIALIPVILFHAGFEWFSGGYVGVDVFFVISGYLITSIILQEKQAGKFSFSYFYERRARRILPALFFIMLACIPFAWFLLLPQELIDFGKTLMASSLFSSNILFWLESDYFSADAEFISLIHTWSLAIEEQFYLFFPLLMISFWTLGRLRLIWILSIIAIVSFALSEWGWRHFPEANFYLLPSRIWELMIGTLTAFYLFQNKQAKGYIGELASVLGLSLILLSVFFLDKTHPFPSVYALSPVIGTTLVILFTHRETLVYRLLSFKALTLIGLISYSAYLWHQPLFVFTRLILIEEPKPWLMGLLSLLTIVLAYFSWRFIEAPFRDKRRFTQRQIYLFSVLGSLLFISIGVSMIIIDGAAFRFS